jgi:hypothetical protein
MDAKDLFGEIHGAYAGFFERMEWAEEEIRAAQKRCPAKADELYHSFILCKPADHSDLANCAEFAYRSHVQEILSRVIAGEDTRPATNAEMIMALIDVSQMAPMNTLGSGLYFRLWREAGFPPVTDGVLNEKAYEDMRGEEITEAKADMRRRLTVADRVLRDDPCGGMHHGEKVSCKLAAAALAAA